MAMIVLKKIVSVPTEVKPTPGTGPSVGQLVDDMLAQAALEHEQVMEVGFHISDEEWATLSEGIRGNARPLEAWEEGAKARRR